MCGIVGYIGNGEATPLLLEGLSRLEYRGYDSAGLCVLAADGDLEVRRVLGRLSGLEKEVEAKPVAGSLGIGHTRWATHGAPSIINCHPHTTEPDSTGRVAVVHNGIIENYLELREELQAGGRVFCSETDTEVLPHLIDRALADTDDPLTAIAAALSQARGAYAIGVILKDQPDTLYAARQGSPLIIGLAKDKLVIASDVPAVAGAITDAVYLEDGEVAALHRNGSGKNGKGGQTFSFEVRRLDGSSVTPEITPVTIGAEASDKGGFDTYMLKEIHEQPRVMRGLLERHIKAGDITLDLGGLDVTALNRVLIVSCGTAYYAAMYGRLLFEHLTALAVETDLGSEFRYRHRKLDPKTLVIAVSQSGETADTLASIRMARSKGCKVLSICNVEGSSLVRDSDLTVYTQAGPEIGVASTKAFTAQLMAFALLILRVARDRGELDDKEFAAHLKDLNDVPDDIHYILNRKESIQPIADKHHSGPSALYLGRRFNYPIALEGALKNKEISYQHAEGYAAGEMKHGPIALINQYMPVVCICTQTEDEVYEKMISNIKEVEARRGRIIAIATEGDKAIRDIAEDIIYVTANREAYSPMINVVALQLLAYYAALARGTDIDKPRNLAKSVTVE